MHQQRAQTSNSAIRGAKVGRSLTPAIENQDLLSQQYRFGDDGTEPSRSTKPDYDDNGVQEKAENVSHALDRIKRESSRIHITCGIRHQQERPYSVRR